jgi:hypothetical protein
LSDNSSKISPKKKIGSFAVTAEQADLSKGPSTNLKLLTTRTNKSSSTPNSVELVKLQTPPSAKPIKFKDDNKKETVRKSPNRAGESKPVPSALAGDIVLMLEQVLGIFLTKIRTKNVGDTFE